MKKVFDEVNTLDKECYDKYQLSEDILIEHAALGIYTYIKKKYKKNSSVLIVVGSGNNGADGYALARLLQYEYKTSIYIASQAKSQMAKIQYERVKKLNIKIEQMVYNANIIVDCLLGTGLKDNLSQHYKSILNKLNNFTSAKIACDIPSGINNLGQIKDIAFRANITITMGALKTALFTDNSKEYTGKIIIKSLGLRKDYYESHTNTYLLSKKDLILPKRTKVNSNKGTYGHLNIVTGSKTGASIIASLCAFNFGCGLVSIVSEDNILIPYEIMQTNKISYNCTAIAIGMGLGKINKYRINEIININLPKVIDADLFYDEIILNALNKECVLTPHPKEFISLLKLTKIANITIEELQDNRFLYARLFSNKFPKTVLLLKGANQLIANNNNIYINNIGKQSLSKGGSGDALVGLIGSLLSQGYNPLHSAIHSSLALSISSKNYKKNNYSFTPKDLIKEIKKL